MTKKKLKAKTKTKKTVKKVAKPRKAAAKKPELHAYLVIDRSGSMSDQWTEAIGSVNAYVGGLRKEKDIAGYVTVTVFDSNGGLDLVVLRDKVKLADWTDLKKNEASPRGTTPLYDAVGRVATDALKVGGDRAMIVIMTDGHENASREFTRQSVNEILDKARARGWQVIFLGANFDAMAQAASLGTQSSHTLNIAPQNLVASMASFATASANYTRTAAYGGFTAKDRATAARGRT